LLDKTKQGSQITGMVTGVASPVGAQILAQGDTLSILTGRPPTLTTTPPVRQTIFTIRNRTPICELSLAAPLLQMMVYDQSGNPASGLAIIISSSEGKERILTGLKPERGAGYMDLILSPGILYSFIIEGADGNSETISVSDCSSPDGSPYPGGWLFEIQLGNR
jgi:hypothetical protein